MEAAMRCAITRILVPLDFSGPSDAALEYATGLAERLGASLHLLHVFEDPLWTTGAMAADMYVPVPEGLRESLLANARTQLEERARKLDVERFHPTTDVYTGPIANAITEFATRQQTDLIVIGTHGRGGMSHLLLGSVAERVVRNAPCPVLTVRTSTVGKPPAPVAAV
jgi:nucleotide-binding universal stress UspA family protein